MVYNVYNGNRQPILLESHELICGAYAKSPNCASYEDVETNPKLFVSYRLYVLHKYRKL